ncbi:hypothetical protein OGV25_09330 [Pseudomonas sp. P1B16]|uniref:hypothetical protein n=1 Tax=Pseudomonas sp. P1B16 TaxID=2986074 RepID=UPI002A24077B|nr:hypothetical protein [Pseudomonas sp. P1B16]WPM29280.1 hypothetical protein OGV25_09330 [Pseudomonas sp. P1B16]
MHRSFDRGRATEGFTQADQAFIGFDLQPKQLGAFGQAQRSNTGNLRHCSCPESFSENGIVTISAKKPIASLSGRQGDAEN